MKIMKNKKGITLVEVIVVLVIMAVLAGVLVGAYTGYIDKAKQSSAIQTARNMALALSVDVNEQYASGTTWTFDTVTGYTDKVADYTVNSDSAARLEKLTKLTGVEANLSGVKINESHEIVGFTLVVDSYTVTFLEGTYTVATNP